jgi:cellulose synthase/poly-beta-1,6-N-acetylglucosamine synthase-like glycosyltransferase
VARQGALQRFQKHVRVPRAELDRHFSEHQPTITVLVPSYAEEPEVVRMTLLSAALQEFPSKRVVLLLDDNPNPTARTPLYGGVCGAGRSRSSGVRPTGAGGVRSAVRPRAPGRSGGSERAGRSRR